jgi:L-iditol 2-dehydrogenase
MKDSGKGRVEHAAVPEPRAGEVRIRTAFTGICGSDLHAYMGTHVRRQLPLVPGHEACGVIDAVGSDVQGLSAGSRVTVLPELGCGSCYACASGWPNVCGSKTLLGTDKWPGAFAEYFCAPAINVIELPAGMSLKLAALTEPVAVAVHAIRQAGFCKGQSMLLFGAGGIGSVILALCKILGASHTTVCDLKHFNLGVATAQGADLVLNTADVPASDQFEKLKLPWADAVFIAASHHDLINQSFKLARPHGVIVLVGQFNKPGVIDIDKSRLKEQQIVGSFTYTLDDFREAVRVLHAHPESFLPLITKEISLDEVDETVQAMIAGSVDAIKIVARAEEKV